ncbi:MAG: MFS transporter [Candidatus Roseilinea sp.]|uniref:MFS transporter n=1 Tax=Candidatus Roseilinea sp. TaxID=2838777 RepID=UPI0040497F14
MKSAQSPLVTSARRRGAVVVFFLFLLLHQTDKLLIGPLTTPIMETFGIDESQMGAAFTGALLVGAVLYPVWGYLYDRFARARLVALASAIWGATTWLSALAPNFLAFVISRASTGIDDASYPGIFSMVSDYFRPAARGRVIGLLQFSGPLGYLLGIALALGLGGWLGWRAVFIVTGALGIALALVILIVVREPARGASEPEMIARVAPAPDEARFSWPVARELLRKRSLLLLCAQGFFGVFPWQVITYWIFRYLEVERGYTPDEVFVTMAIAVVVMSSGYVVGGVVGDALYRRWRRGRLMASAAAVLIGAALLPLTLGVPVADRALFLLMLCLNAIFIPFAGPNVNASVHDIALPEVRSTALAMLNFIESIGSALAPLIAGIIAVQSSLGDAMLLICITAWLICAVVLTLTAALIPRDMDALRAQMRVRGAAQA